jgi:hypothetical protein
MPERSVVRTDCHQCLCHMAVSAPRITARASTSTAVRVVGRESRVTNHEAGERSSRSVSGMDNYENGGVWGGRHIRIAFAHGRIAMRAPDTRRPPRTILGIHSLGQVRAVVFLWWLQPLRWRTSKAPTTRPGCEVMRGPTRVPA